LWRKNNSSNNPFIKVLQSLDFPKDLGFFLGKKPFEIDLKTGYNLPILKIAKFNLSKRVNS
jgi:hypothetical protein